MHGANYILLSLIKKKSMQKSIYVFTRWKRMKSNKCLTIIQPFIFLVLTHAVIYIVHGITNPRHKFSSQTLINIAMRDHVIASRTTTLEWPHLTSHFMWVTWVMIKNVNTHIYKHKYAY